MLKASVRNTNNNQDVTSVFQPYYHSWGAEIVWFKLDDLYFCACLAGLIPIWSSWRSVSQNCVRVTVIFNVQFYLLRLVALLGKTVPRFQDLNYLLQESPMITNCI